jgi:hypothetical protein
LQRFNKESGMTVDVFTEVTINRPADDVCNVADDRRTARRIVCALVVRSSPTGPEAGYVQSMPKSRPAKPAPQTEKSEEFARLAEGTLVSAQEGTGGSSIERTRARAVRF